jgi:inorganic pyrophosphatase
MNILHDLPAGTPQEVNIFIEIPKGSKNKYELDKDTGLITLDRVFYSAYAYPMDYGMVPQTHWHDGDPLDALVINTVEPYFPGVVVPARPIAVVRMVDDGEKDEKLICVPVDDPRLAEFKDKDDIAPHVLKELIDFFENYKKLQGKTVKIEGIDGRAEAEAAIEEGQQLYQEKYGK